MNKLQKGKKYLIVISGILIVFLTNLIFCNYKKEVVFAEGINSLSLENFSRDSIIVVLDEEVSDINKLHNKDIFIGVEIKAIEDLTRNSYNLSSSKKIFRQILKIELVNDSRENVLSSIETLKKLDFVVSAEPDYYYDLESEPLDYHYGEGRLWGLNNSDGVQAPLAWNITRGSSLVRVGVLDTGIANHEDLNANLVEGYDSFNNNTITTDDTRSHGTHVAGTIGAVGNNNIGVVGVNWNVQLVPLQAVNEDNKFSSSNVIEAIAWATSKWGTSEQIDIINYSVGGLGRTTSVREAVRNYPGLFVWSAGNQDTDIDGFIEENGTFDLSNVITVGAVKENGERPNVNDWGYDKDGQVQGSNYSTNGQNVSIYAPGQSVLSTGLNDSYEYKNGTSMAAPHVTGVAALMLSINPNLTSVQLKSAILANADPITITIPNAGGGTTEQTVKKLNAFKAVSSVAFQTNAQGNCITGLNFEPTGELEFPNNINGITITSIGANAFENQTQLTSVTLPDTITSIGEMAFKGCTFLSSINIPICLETIGKGAFAGCSFLEFDTHFYHPNFCIENNIIYNADKTKIIASGSSMGIDETGEEVFLDFIVPETVTEIEDYAFYQNYNIKELKFDGAPIIGDYAFYECDNIDAIYFYSTSVLDVGFSAFANDILTAYVPNNLVSVYNEIFENERIQVSPITIEIALSSDNNVYSTVSAYYGAPLSITIPTKTGYTFKHWVDGQGNVYQNGEVLYNKSNFTLEAVWEAEQYYISFSGFGSENLENITVTYGQQIGVLPEPVKTGHTFNGWKDENGTFYTQDTIWQNTNNLILTSDFSANTYTIIYQGNGGTISAGTQAVQYGSVVSDLAVAYKEGFTFIGWNTQPNGDGDVIVAPYAYEIASDVVLYAQYTANIYGVTFDKQGGTGGDNGVNAIYNEQMPSTTAPTKVGYTFGGYYAQPNGVGTQYYDANMSSVNVWNMDNAETLYAKWTANIYVVILDAQGGTGGSLSVNATYASSMPEAIAPTRPGYTFGGYFTQPNGAGTQYYNVGMASVNVFNIAEDTTLYAKWTANTYNIVLDLQGGTGGTTSVVVTYDSEMPTATAPTKTGYTFIGYYASANGGEKYYNADMSSARSWNNTTTTTLYASWQANTYAITFDKQGGTGGSSYVNVTYGSPMPTAIKPTKSKHVFLGYYSEPNGAGVKYYNADMTSAKNFDKTSSITLYANWEGETYRINYLNTVFSGEMAKIILDNNMNKDAPLSYKYGEGFSFSNVSAIFDSNRDIRFLGWYTNTNFTTKITNLSTTRSGEVTVYAKWRYDYNRYNRAGAYYITDDDPYTTGYQDRLVLNLNTNNLYQELKSLGINYVYLEFKLKIREVDDGYQEVMIYKSTSPTTNPIWVVDDIDHYPSGTGTTAQYYIWRCQFSIDDLKDCNYLYVRYGANGNWGDDWVTDEIYVDVMYTVTTSSEENVLAFKWDYSASVSDASCIPLENVSDSY